MKILSIFGTRPEAIKLAPIIKKMKKNKKITLISCATAQHRHILDQVLQTFDIKLNYDLDLMTKNQDLNYLAQRILKEVSKILIKEKPDYILVQGDTTTALFSSIAAFHNNIKIAHLEAGLRTYDKFSPWPEEINRRLISSLASINFCPTSFSRDNLIRENIHKDNILITGNSVIDALLIVKEKITTNILTQKKLSMKYNFFNNEKKKILVTLHRRESHKKHINQICIGLLELLKEYKGLEIIVSVHPNPNVKKIIIKKLADKENIYLIDSPVYEEFIYLMINSYLILTDSGGIQEEAPSLNIPVLIARDKTERPEGIKAGSSILVGRNKENIKSIIIEFINNKKKYEKHSKITNPYGDGTTSDRVMKYFLNISK